MSSELRLVNQLVFVMSGIGASLPFERQSGRPIAVHIRTLNVCFDGPQSAAETLVPLCRRVGEEE